MIAEKITNRNRTMSLQQRIVCEFFQANPDATRVQCKKSTGLSEKSVSQKVRALLRKGYLAGDPEKINAKFKVTGKQFPPSTDYEPNQKWVGQRMRADARMESQVIVLDSLSAAFHAMVSTGRAAA